MDLIFLIKSIMNKKLFSWKALAGLALLVAMGLTSCKQDNAVTLDEDGNYKVPEKPVTPTASGTNLKGFKTVAELNTLIAGTKDITDNIKAGGSVTINLDCSNLEAAAGDKIIIPGKSDATINLVFTNKAKKNEGLVIADDALDVVTVTFPEGEFGDVSFEMPYSTLTLASAGASTLGKTAFNVNKNNKSELATTIDKGITINSIKTWFVDATTGFNYTGDILIKDGAAINALTVDKDYAQYSWIGNGNFGYAVPQITTDLKNWKSYYVKNLNVVANKVTVNAWGDENDKVVVEKISIAEGDTVYVNGAWANEIVGAGKGAVLGNFNASAPAKYSNLTIDGGDANYGTGMKATFEKCTLKDFRSIYMKSAAKEIKFTHDVSTYTNLYYVVDAPADATSFKFSFEKCEFATNTSINPYTAGENVLDKNGNPIKQTLYRYGYYDKGTDWKTVTGVEKFTDIPDSIRMGTTKQYSYYTSYNYEPKVIPYTNIVLNPSLKECKYDGAAVTNKNATQIISMWNNLQDADGKDVSVTKPIIDDKVYKYINTSAGWILIEE